MTFARRLTQTATVIHHAATGSDSEGNPTFATATTVDYPCRLEQTDSVEIVQGERRTTTNLVLFLDPEAIAETFEDEVLVDGVRYQVEGQPEVLRTPRGLHHIETRLRRVGR